MVTTRSGRQVELKDASTSMRRVGKLSAAKLPRSAGPKPAFTILEDMGAAPSTAKSHVFCLTAGVEHTESSRKVQPAFFNDENVNIINKEQPVRSVVETLKTVKVIGISDQEKTMNGAPEGALYEVTVSEDDSLLAFDSMEEAALQLKEAINIYRTCDVWASKFDAILTMRRCHRQFSAALRDCQIFDAVLDASLDSMLSLRSTSAKNALLCLRSLLPNDLLQEENRAERTATALVNRLAGSGPKFLVDFAYGVAEGAAKIFPCVTFVAAVGKHLTHRSLELQRKVALLVLIAINRGLELRRDEDIPKLLPALIDCATKVTNQAVQQSARSSLLSAKARSQERWADWVATAAPEEHRRKAVFRAVEEAQAKLDQLRE